MYSSLLLFLRSVVVAVVAAVIGESAGNSLVFKTGAVCAIKEVVIDGDGDEWPAPAARLC